MDFANFWFQNGVTPPKPPASIGNSLRFRGAQTLNRAAGGSGTGSVWIKRANLGSAQTVMGLIAFASNDTLNSSPGVYRDPSAWMHVVISTLGTYVNGVFVKAGAALNAGTIGSSFDGYLTEFHFVDGQALGPTEFGEFNADGVWVLRAASIDDYGTNGFYLDFSDPDDIGADRSGNGNNFTANGFELTNTTSPNYDWMADSPIQNYATINPLYPGASTSNANLTTANATGKPSILGVAGNGWDGTEAGWVTTGDVDFGQRTAADEISTRTIDAVSITNPSDHFDVITDTGANILTAAQAKFPNGLWWIKDRVNANQHQLVDSVRGSANAIQCPAALHEQPYSAPAASSVAWCWKTDANGLNKEAGFEIVKFTGTYPTPQAVPHNLGKTPDLLMVHPVQYIVNTSSQLWVVDHVSLNNRGITCAVLNNNASQITDGTQFNSTAPTDTHFTVGSSRSTNAPDVDCIAYLWTSVPSYSAFGSYTGNGNTNGPFIYTGFKPAFLLVKRLLGGVGSWHICDTTRDTDNPSDHVLFSDLPQAEVVVGGNKIDLLSNGFKCRSNDTTTNTSGSTYIYAAFAENPFGGSNVSPTTAR